MIPFTKTLDPADMDDPEFLDQLVHVDKQWDTSQHPMRRWEYGLALLAYKAWVKTLPDQPLGAPHEPTVLDVGGAGSPFQRICAEVMPLPTIVDPKSTGGIEIWRDDPVDVIFSISTFEHTTHPLEFLDAMVRRLKPHGLLFMTFDYNGSPQARIDTYHFHWMRERIINPAKWDALVATLVQLADMELFGAEDWTDHGNHVYDYTFASLCLQKGPHAPD